MPPPSLGYVLKFPLPSLGRLYVLRLRGSRTAKRTIRSNVEEADFELDRCLAKI